MNDYLFDVEMKEDRQRTTTVNGKEFVFRASDPYGFWSIYKIVGNKETELPGVYTSLIEAEKAAAKFTVEEVKTKKEKN